MNIDHFVYIVVYVHNSAVHALTLLFLPIFFLTFIEPILENDNDTVCLLSLSNEVNTEMCYKKYKDSIETFIFYVMEDEKVIIILTVNSQISIPNGFVVGYHEYKLRFFPSNYK